MTHLPGQLLLIAAVSLAAGPASTSAEEAIKFEALAGVVFEVRFVRDQTLLREGRQVSNRFQNDLTVKIGPGERIEQTVSPTAYTKQGVRHGKTSSGLFTLEQTRQVASRGGGHSVWIFGDGALTFLRTFKGGAMKRVFSFTRAGSVLNCSASETFAREQGVNGIVLESGIDGLPSVILSARPVSSTCRITQQNNATQ